MASSLPDDLLLEVLVLVKDAAALFRCATACKGWHHLAVNPTFLRRRWPEDGWDSSSFVGFLILGEHNIDFGARSFPTPEPWFVLAPRSALSLGRCGLGSLVTAPRAGLFDRAVPLVSRHHLLRIQDKGSSFYEDQTILRLTVCNLFVGTCDTLPPLNFSSEFKSDSSNGYAILTGEDCRSEDESSSSLLPSKSPFFRVIIIGSAREDNLLCDLLQQKKLEHPSQLLQ